MNIVCITVGKKRAPEFVEAIELFEKRLRPYVQFSFAYIPSSEKSIESSKINALLKDDDHVWLLDERGKPIDNQAMTNALEALQNTSIKRLVIIIGGAYGVDESVFDRAHKTLALSGLVFPHQLVRLIVVEQLYRSFNTLAGGKYHHAD
jgi:23S rRNA (pseudouridine1915-N3)-methyltransferase